MVLSVYVRWKDSVISARACCRIFDHIAEPQDCELQKPCCGVAQSSPTSKSFLFTVNKIKQSTTGQEGRSNQLTRSEHRRKPTEWEEVRRMGIETHSK